MFGEAFTAFAREARRRGLGGALDQPIALLRDADAPSGEVRRIIEHTAGALRLRTIADLCRPEVDAYVGRVFGAPLLRAAAEGLARWLAAHEGGDDLEVDDDHVVAAGELDLFAAQVLRKGARLPGGLPPPPCTIEELRRWAEEHGVSERLADPAPAVVSLGLGQPRLAAAATVEEVLTSDEVARRPGERRPWASAERRPGPGERRSWPVETDRWEGRMRRDAAVAYLLRFAENLQFLRARRRSGVGAADPLFAGLERAVEATRASLAPAPPRPEGEFIPVPLHFVEEPPALLYGEAISPRDQLLLGSVQPGLVRIGLAGWEAGRLSVRCTCGDAVRGCPHPAAALDALADLVRDPSCHAHRPLRDFLAIPPWTRFLGRLDRALAAVAPREAAAKERLVWRLAGGQDGFPVLEPQRQKRTAQGGWTRGSRLSISELARRAAELVTEADQRAVEILTEGLDAGMSVAPGAVPGRTWRALEALAGAPHLYLDDRRDAPVVIQVVKPRLRFIRADGDQGAVVLRIALGERLIDPGELLERLPDGRHYVETDVQANLCRLARVEPELAALAEAFAAEPAPFPDDALPEVLRRLERVERVAGLDLPAELRGTTVAADGRLVCRLTPIADGGLRLELRVRPLPGAEDWPPGDGPRVVVASRDGDRVSAERALEAEREAGLHLLADVELGLGAATPTRPWVFEVVDGDKAFALFLALREHAGGAALEWPAEAWQVDQVRRSELRLRVTERRDWFGLEGGVEIDGQAVPIQALLEAVRRGQRYVVLGPRRFAVIEEELRRRLLDAQEVLHQGRAGIEMGVPAAEVVADLVEDAAALESVSSFRQLRERLQAAAAREPVVPAALAATLRPYQAEGFRWLSRLAAGGAGACLADDMGLGKTVQVLAALLERAGEGPALVVAPTSVVPNWIAEAERFAPSLRRVLHWGPARSSALAGLVPGDLVVTSYALAVRDAEELAAIPFASLVFDEAQALKNAATRRSRALGGLQAGWRVALTGTPIENHLGELWSLYRVLSPALFGSWEQFRERFAVPIERQNDGERRRVLGRLLRPFLLRRTKQSVAPELPAKIEVQRMVDLSAGERQLYEQTRVAALAQLGQQEGDGAHEGQARIQILAALTRLRQLACHPRLGDARSRLPSSKVEALAEILTEVREAGHRSLLFSQFTRFLDLVRDELTARGFTLLGLDGSTPAETRADRVAAFQRGEADAFLISLRAGGTGLNLTAADYVIHLDPWWNPAVEDQATDRAHRIGQTRAVTVVRLVARGTVEEAVLALHEDKRGLAASILDGTDTAARLGASELLALLRAHPDDASDETDDPDTAPDEAPPSTWTPPPPPPG